MKPLRVCIIKPPALKKDTVQNKALDISSIQKALHAAEIQVKTLSYSEDLLPQLHCFCPELLLIQLSASSDAFDLLSNLVKKISKEIGKEIKTIPSLPLIFISTQSELPLYLELINSYGDGLLIEPQPEQYISMIKTRILRARQWAEQMMHDSLTGLINHNCILEQLNIEMARAKRNKTPLSFAMLDIDHFKCINDDYGHTTGDKVLQQVAHLFKKRLRSSDSIGRYGGDEFAIILPESSALTIFPIMKQIKNSFAQYVYTIDSPHIHDMHPVKMQKIQATFSVGIANWEPEMRDASALVQAADTALYQAKHQGRNQIIIFGA